MHDFIRTAGNSYSPAAESVLSSSMALLISVYVTANESISGTDSLTSGDTILSGDKGSLLKPYRIALGALQPF